MILFQVILHALEGPCSVFMAFPRYLHISIIYIYFLLFNTNIIKTEIFASVCYSVCEHILHV